MAANKGLLGVSPASSPCKSITTQVFPEHWGEPADKGFSMPRSLKVVNLVKILHRYSATSTPQNFLNYKGNDYFNPTHILRVCGVEFHRLKRQPPWVQSFGVYEIL